MRQNRTALCTLGALMLAGCVTSAPQESTLAPVDPEISQSQSSNGVATQAVNTLDCDSMSFDDWPDWTRINASLLESEGHGNSWVDIVVNDLAKDTYLSADAPFAECSVVVKPLYVGDNRDMISSLFVMVKMPAGYDPENSNWWYGKFDASGTYASAQGRVEGCIECHKDAAETDYMFSKEVLQAMSE